MGGQSHGGVNNGVVDGVIDGVFYYFLHYLPHLEHCTLIGCEEVLAPWNNVFPSILALVGI